jgi:hypothetical protein
MESGGLGPSFSTSSPGIVSLVNYEQHGLAAHSIIGSRIPHRIPLCFSRKIETADIAAKDVVALLVGVRCWRNQGKFPTSRSKSLQQGVNPPNYNSCPDILF